MHERTPAEQADDVRRMYDAGLCGREAAIREMRAVLHTTEEGAADLLDHPEMPSVRYAEVVADV